MKLVLIVAFAFLPLISCASSQISEDINSPINSIVSQKAQESGITFVSNANEYQLIHGGHAIKRGLSASSASTSDSQAQSEPLWEGTSGEFNLTISNSNTNQQNLQVLSNGIDYNQIAYNPRTKNIAIITGQIVVFYTANYDAKTISTTFGLQLADDFVHLKIAAYKVGTHQNIFTLANSLNQSGLVSSAEIEVIENFAMPN